ncbi:hypothetical protein ASPCADRAFT_128069 [Aspergillus carbonarius ITEM 5010]|uniref:Nucleoside phosphorylase domain-containing protein n=1 Tax=Aspergillus carbonarius (strain ITEM 5010) TaxID=602072 RepID=A0A1R3RTV0_ASPC5|nr:hypothetical protein ASPCADRAFT_128069 [Aspergillus carbonarius ITEM 5010]
MKDMPGFQRPDRDRLYRVDYEHRGGRSCEFCSEHGLVKRKRRSDSREIAIHYGTIASGNTVVKDPVLRDKWANTPRLNVLCFEMEASGMMPTFPSLAIRGICDYSDDHKNDEWHNYAALTAAAYTRALLLILKPKVIGAVPSRVKHEPQTFHGLLLGSLSSCLRIMIRHVWKLKGFIFFHPFISSPIRYLFPSRFA